jgi:hypothetical protein
MIIPLPSLDEQSMSLMLHLPWMMTCEHPDYAYIAEASASARC